MVDGVLSALRVALSIRLCLFGVYLWFLSGLWSIEPGAKEMDVKCLHSRGIYAATSSIVVTH